MIAKLPDGTVQEFLERFSKSEITSCPVPLISILVTSHTKNQTVLPGMYMKRHGTLCRTHTIVLLPPKSVI